MLGHISPSAKKAAIPIKKHSTQFCKALTEAMELAKQKDSQIFKVCSEHVLKMNTNIDNSLKPTQNNIDNGLLTTSKDVYHTHPTTLSEASKSQESFKIGIEPVMKIASEAPKMSEANGIEESRIGFEKAASTQNSLETSSIKNNSVVNGSTDKQDKQLNGSSNSAKSLKSQMTLKVADAKKLVIKAKNFDCLCYFVTFLRRLADHQPQGKAAAASAQTNCVGHICGHKCKEGKQLCVSI